MIGGYRLLFEHNDTLSFLLRLRERERERQETCLSMENK
jgi:hypothetical protein